MKVGIIGAGRIGKVHAKNISMFVPEMEIKTIADPFMNEQTEAFAKSCGIPNTTKDANDILNDPEIDAVPSTSSRLLTQARTSSARSRSIMIWRRFTLPSTQPKKPALSCRSVSAAASTTTTVQFTTWFVTARSAR